MKCVAQIHPIQQPVSSIDTKMRKKGHISWNQHVQYSVTNIPMYIPCEATGWLYVQRGRTRDCVDNPQCIHQKWERNGHLQMWSFQIKNILIWVDKHCYNTLIIVWWNIIIQGHNRITLWWVSMLFGTSVWIVWITFMSIIQYFGMQFEGHHWVVPTNPLVLSPLVPCKGIYSDSWDYARG